MELWFSSSLSHALVLLVEKCRISSMRCMGFELECCYKYKMVTAEIRSAILLDYFQFYDLYRHWFTRIIKFGGVKLRKVCCLCSSNGSASEMVKMDSEFVWRSFSWFVEFSPKLERCLVCTGLFEYKWIYCL